MRLKRFGNGIEERMNHTLLEMVHVVVKGRFVPKKSEKKL